jgi:hypothetical protein
MTFQFWRNRFAFTGCLALVSVVIAGVIFAQDDSSRDDTQQRIQDHLSAGEFPLAISLANTLPEQPGDHWLAQISQSQLQSGSRSAAFDSAGLIQSDQARAKLLSSLANNSGRPLAGQAGGITAADFDPLIDLITNTIANDSWIDTGQGLGTIQAYPAGVFVDSAGTLRKMKVDPQKTSRRISSDLFTDSGNRQPQMSAELRKVSLTRLEREAQLLAAQGLPLDETMQNLAGITEVQFLMADPETGDVVIAGPAGPWKKDERNRSVNAQAGTPVLQLDDLVVCLRNAWENNGKFGCAITPRQKNLAATQEFLATSKLKGTSWSRKIRELLGQQDIHVFGIDDRTHTARVLVEADYRMKLIGMGLEPSVPGVPSFLERIQLTPDGSVPPLDVVRWWFTLNYDDVFADESGLIFTFTGSGVKVLSENELLDEHGQRIHTGQSHGPAKEFARDFTKQFASLSTEYPIYRELKNVFDMALVASLIRHQQLAQKTNWHLTYFGPERADSLTYHPKLDAVATQVDSVMNQHVLKTRKQSSTVKHTIVGVSGGISYDAHEAMGAEKIKLADHQFDEAEKLRPVDGENHWWWD